MISRKRSSAAEAHAHLAQIAPALHAVRKGMLPPADAVAWPSGLDRALLYEFPLSTRTWNCLTRANLTSGQSELGVGALMLIPNFGRTSLSDLLLTVEKYLIERTLAPGVPQHDSPGPVLPRGAPTIVDPQQHRDGTLLHDSNTAAGLPPVDLQLFPEGKAFQMGGQDPSEPRQVFLGVGQGRHRQTLRSRLQRRPAEFKGDRSPFRGEFDLELVAEMLAKALQVAAGVPGFDEDA